MVLWSHGSRAVIRRQNPGRAAADPSTVRQVMHEWARGQLRSSSGRRVKKYRQAVAIALAEGRRARRHTMRRNPRGGGGGIVQLVLLGGAAWFLLRSPGPGQPSLLTSLTSGGTGTAGQLTLPVGAAVPPGYRVIAATAAGQRTIAPIPPGLPGYNPTIYQSVTAATGVLGGLTALLNTFRTALGLTPASAAIPAEGIVTYSAVGADPALANATAQFDSQGNVIGYHQLNADGTTTTWDAAGGNPVMTDLAGTVMDPYIAIPDLNLSFASTIDPITGFPIDFSTAAFPDTGPTLADYTDPSLSMDIWAAGP